MKVLQIVGFLLLAATFLTGCSSSGRTKSQSIYSVNLTDNGPTNLSTGGNSLEDTTGPLAKRIVYFVNDSNEVQPESMQVVNNHANFLATNKAQTVVLEGHADERGSPEYTIALGEQYAKSVAKLMKQQGVSDNQIQIVSFGEEKAAVSGHDENAWRQNRRVEITYPEH